MDKRRNQGLSKHASKRVHLEIAATATTTTTTTDLEENDITVKQMKMQKWIQTVLELYPDLLTKPFMVPPVHFNRVAFGVRDFDQLKVKVQEPIQQLSDVRGQEAQQRVHHTLSQFFSTQRANEPAFVVFSLAFDNYLNYRRPGTGSGTRKSQGKRQQQQKTWDTTTTTVEKVTDDKSAKGDNDKLDEIENTMFVRPRDLSSGYQRGQFDVLIIHKRFGLIVCEIKTVGDLLSPPSPQDQLDFDIHSAVKKRIQRSLVQLKKAEYVLRQLVSDLNVTQPIRKALILPNLKREFLHEVLTTDVDFQQDFSKCFQTSSWQECLKLCIFCDQLPPLGMAWGVDDFIMRRLNDDWWENITAAAGGEHARPLDDQQYLSLVARFCGPATSQRVQITAQQQADVKTLHDAVRQTSRCLATLSLNASQVGVLEKDTDNNVMLMGPPGTGKSLVLAVQAVRWLRAGLPLVIINLWRGSEAASRNLLNMINILDSSVSDRVKLLNFNCNWFDIPHELAAEHSSPDIAASDLGDILDGATDFWAAPTSTNMSPQEAPRSSEPTSMQNGIKISSNYLERAREALKSSNPTSKQGVLRMMPDETRKKNDRLKVIVDEAPWFFPSFVEVLQRVFDGVGIWAATSYPAARPGLFKEESLTRIIRCPPVVVRQLQKGMAYSMRAMPRYEPFDAGVESGLPLPTDGPPVKRIQHGQHKYGIGGKKDVWDCPHCAAKVAKFLTEELGIGKTRENQSHGDRLHFKDVIISGHVTVPSESDELTATNGMGEDELAMDTHSVVQSMEDNTEIPADKKLPRDVGLPGFLVELRKHGVPIGIVHSGDKNGVDGLVSPYRPDVVCVAEPESILGIERPVVVVIGTNDVRETYPRYVDPWLDVIACCTAQLVIVEGMDSCMEDQLLKKLVLNNSLPSYSICRQNDVTQNAMLIN